jgi:hypothetical protein
VESKCSEAETVHQIKVSDCDMVDPGLTSGSTELPLSVMEEDKVDVSTERDILCNPLAGSEPEENQIVDNEVFCGIWRILAHSHYPFNFHEFISSGSY